MTEQLGRYEILDKLGQGGFAIVYRGHDKQLERQVALKELRPILLQDESWIKRFRLEARTIARLDHPHIVPIYDIYEAQERMFIVMRLVEGSSLESVITARERLSWKEVLEITSAVADGLDYAHKQGILHRDLKPANILMDQKRGPMLSDFGLAKLTGDASMSASATGAVVGTPHYIAPEVWEGEKATQQSDIYAMGCILFEMLTGEKVFKGDTPPAVMMAHFRAPELPAVWPEGVPNGVTTILNTALAKRPAERYQTATEMATSLAALTNGQAETSRAGTVTPVLLADEAESPQSATISEPTTPSDVQSQQRGEEPADPLKTKELSPQVEPSAETPVLQSEPVVPETKEARKRNRHGCWWIGIGGTILLLIVAVLGVGTFCSTLGSTLGTNLSTAFTPIETGETVIKDFDIPHPASDDPTELTVEFGFGELVIEPGTLDDFAHVHSTYNVPDLEPKYSIDDNKIRLQLKENIGLSGFTTPDLENSWNVTLAAVPMDLILNVGAAESEIELGGLPLQDVTIHQGAADFNLAFSELNPVEMDTLTFTGGASSATLKNLANAHANDIRFEGGFGNYTLDFSGELQASTDVSIEAGLGSITIIVPEEINAEVVFEGSAANITITDAWQQSGDQFVLSGSGNSDHKLTFDIKMGPGGVKLSTE